VLHRPSYGLAHRALGLAPVGLMRPQRPQRDEVIYQSVLRAPASPQKLQQLQQQQALNNGTCDIAAVPGCLPFYPVISGIK